MQVRVWREQFELLDPKSGPGSEQSQDLALLGKASLGVLREDELAVDDDVEDPVVSTDQLRAD
jgi:hypothetical protein